MAEHLAAYEAKAGKPHSSLANAPKLPPEVGYLWSDFLELHGSRGSTMAGPAPITFGDIDAWQRVTGKTLDPWELTAVRLADGAYFDELAKRVKK